MGKQWLTLFLGASKITADGDSSHEIKRHLLLGRKVITNLDSTNKGPSSQGYGFSNDHVWMWELDCEESWALKNWCFWTAELEKTLESPTWTARSSNQSILKEISPEYSLKGLMLKLKLNTLATWWEELTHWKRPWDWERLKAGGERDARGWDGWRASLIQWTWVWTSSRN